MSKFRNILRGTIGAVAIGAAVVAFVPSSASAAPATPAPAGNVVQIPLTRVVNVPGDTISIGQTRVIQVAGTTFGNGVNVPANATGVFGRLVAFQAPHGESLVVWDGVKGKPGDATVTAGPTTPASSGPSQAFTSSLNNGNLSVASLSGSGSFLLEVTGYVVPVAAPDAGNILHNSFGADVPANGQALIGATCAGTADANLPASTDYPIGGDAPNGDAAGYVAIGGGYSVGNGSGSVTGVNVSMSRDELTYTNGAGWLVTAQNTTGAPVNVRAWVICIPAPGDNPND